MNTGSHLVTFFSFEQLIQALLNSCAYMMHFMQRPVKCEALCLTAIEDQMQKSIRGGFKEALFGIYGPLPQLITICLDTR